MCGYDRVCHHYHLACGHVLQLSREIIVDGFAFGLLKGWGGGGGDEGR